MEVVQSLSIIAGFAGSVSAIIIGILTLSRAGKKDSNQDGRLDGTILTEIGYVKGGIDDIKKKQETQDRRHIEVIERLAQVEASAKQAHKRIDEIANHQYDHDQGG